MPTQHSLERRLDDGRSVEAFVVIQHEASPAGDRNTRFSHGWLRIGMEPQVMLDASLWVKTDDPHMKSDEQLAEAWLDVRLKECLEQ